jgi:Uma2 family endonuclease
MGMPQAAQRWTPAMVRALPDDGNRYEVVAGELLVTPAPSFDHQQTVARQPDVFVAPRLQGRRPKHWSDITRLLLAVEVLSPSTAREAADGV